MRRSEKIRKINDIPGANYLPGLVRNKRSEVCERTPIFYRMLPHFARARIKTRKYFRVFDAHCVRNLMRCVSGDGATPILISVARGRGPS